MEKMGNGSLPGTVRIDQNGQNEIITFLDFLFDANQLVLLPFCSQASHF